jgi:hypothetical protein
MCLRAPPQGGSTRAQARQGIHPLAIHPPAADIPTRAARPSLRGAPR